MVLLLYILVTHEVVILMLSSTDWYRVVEFVFVLTIVVLAHVNPAGTSNGSKAFQLSLSRLLLPFRLGIMYRLQYTNVFVLLK